MSQQGDVIFQSKLLLYYKNKQIESDYSSSHMKATRISNKILMVMMVMISLGMGIWLIVYKQLYHLCCTPLDQYIILSVFIGLVVVIDIPIAFITYICSERECLQNKIAYYSFFNIKFHMTLLKIFLELIFKKKDFHYFYFLSILDYIFRSSLYIFGVVDFIPSFIINIVLLGIIMGIYYAISTINAIIFDNGASFIILEAGSILSSYCITYFRKVNHYYLIGLKEKEREGIKIINSLNTGYLKIIKGNIRLINNSLQCLVEKARKMKGREIISSNINNSAECPTSAIDQETILNFLFRNYCSKHHDGILNQDSEQIQMHTTNNFSTSEILQILLRTYSQLSICNKDNDPEFVFLTSESFDLEDGSQTTYEILFKYKSEEFKIIFNDVTRTKRFEKKEYDSKIQNVFLTKVAHEFKNPLVCIDEILSQITEIALLSNIPDNSSTQIITKCSVIKSFNEYLLMLINDLDYFTLEFNDWTAFPSNCSQMKEEQVNIKELVAYCLEMSNIKLKNLNKSKDVRIEINISNDIPNDVLVNYKKLKHLLVKLLNNAVKYTNKGIITFSIDKCLEENRDELIFIIQDTGIGINESLIYQFAEKNNNNENLFKSNNIGLFIIKHLAKQLGKGKEIQLISKEGIGTTFWFTIPIQTRDICEGINLPIEDKVHHSQQNTNSNKDYQTNRQNKTNCEKLNDSSLTLHKNLLLYLPVTDKDTIDIAYEKELTILFVDDEELARKSSIRIIAKVAKKRQIKINSIESRDGSETLYQLYKHNYNLDQSNNKIDAVISDQKMPFINGSSTITILSSSCNLNHVIPFFIVTAFDPNAIYFNNIKCNGIYCKPLRNNDSEKIIENLLCLN